MSDDISTLELTGAESRILLNALETYISDFGHEDHSLIVAAQHLADKVRAARAVGAAVPNAT